jgi:TRAP-type C4-dicarboxylate transport system permease small subunit
MTFLVWLQILSRVTGYSIQWSEEVTRYLFVWMVFLGSAAGIRTRSHIGAEFIAAALDEKKRCYLTLFQDIVFLLFLLLTVYYSVPFIRMQFEFEQFADTLAIPMYLITAIIPMAFTIGVVHILESIRGTIRRLRVIRDSTGVPAKDRHTS